MIGAPVSVAASLRPLCALCGARPVGLVRAGLPADWHSWCSRCRHRERDLARVRRRSTLAPAPVAPVDAAPSWADCDAAGRGTAARPCDVAGCRHRLPFPAPPPWKADGVATAGGGETCAIRVANRGPVTLEEVGAALDLTRERVRQIEERALRKLRVYGCGALVELLGWEVDRGR